MFTEAEYISAVREENDVKKRTELYRRYYAQFVTADIKKAVLMAFGFRLYRSKDKHLNDIPLKEWDRLGLVYIQHVARVNKRINDKSVYSPSCLVSMLKEAARQVIEEGTTLFEIYVFGGPDYVSGWDIKNVRCPGGVDDAREIVEKFPDFDCIITINDTPTHPDKVIEFTG